MAFKTASFVLYLLGPTLTFAQEKRGLAYNDGALANLFSGHSQVSWGYNWGSDGNGLDTALNFTPMLWGLASRLSPEWTAAVEGEGVEAILGFNEPDLDAHSNITPSDASRRIPGEYRAVRGES
jgi:hypothetical protein